MKIYIILIDFFFLAVQNINFQSETPTFPKIKQVILGVFPYKNPKSIIRWLAKYAVKFIDNKAYDSQQSKLKYRLSLQSHWEK